MRRMELGADVVGVVRFDTIENAETAIEKFSGYQYGGRPLGIFYNTIDS